VHVHLLSYLKDQMPAMMGKEKKQAELIRNMGDCFRNVQRQYNLPTGDFPEIEKFKAKCADLMGGFQGLPKLNKRNQKLLDKIDTVLGVEIPRLMESLPRTLSEESQARPEAATLFNDNIPQVPLPDKQAAAAPPANPFGAEANPFGVAWSLKELSESLAAEFDSLKGAGGKMDAGTAANKMRETGVPQDTLFKIWNLADMDNDGAMDLEEFAIAMHLCEEASGGKEPPATLPTELIPPGRK